MKKTIDGKEVEVFDFPARQGWSILHRLGKICGESLIQASEDNFAASIAAIFQNSTEQEVFDLLEQFAESIRVDGKKLNLSDYGMCSKAIKELLMYNYEDFFSPLVDALSKLEAS